MPTIYVATIARIRGREGCKRRRAQRLAQIIRHGERRPVLHRLARALANRNRKLVGHAHCHAEPEEVAPRGRVYACADAVGDGLVRGGC